jgi:hypothetical protein
MTIIFLAVFIFIFAGTKKINADDDALAKGLAGKLLLQVEDGGKIWYVNPADLKRYAVTSKNSIDIFRSFALGITNYDLDKIPTDINFLTENYDSDGDGYSDKTEAQFGYRIFGMGKAQIDTNTANRLKGKFLLQVEDGGRIWYVNPADGKKYETTRKNTMAIFQNLSLGINNANLEKIIIGNSTAQNIESENSLNNPEILQPEEPEDNPAEISPASPSTPAPNSAPTPSPSYSSTPSSSNIMSSAARSIASGSTGVALNYFTPDIQPSIEYTLNSLNSEGRSIFADLLLNASLTGNGSASKTYSASVSFNNGYAAFNVTLKQQDNGEWLISNL